jgi:hypothetical protein
MAGNARFHDKLHRKNHHTNPTVGFADSATDPIASPSEPFQGDFVLNGKLSASSGIEILSANVSGDIYCNNIHVSSVTYTNFISGNSTETIISDGALTGYGANTLTLDYGKAIYNKVNNNTIMYMNSTNVGIGTVTPNEKLTVSGSISSGNIMYVANNAVIGSTSTNVTGTSATLRFVSSNNKNYIQSGENFVHDSATPLLFTTMFSDTEWARFDKYGNFGIGTSYPTEKLHVNGNLLVTGNISALGDTTQIDTTIVTTSAIIIDTLGTTDALRVTQRGTGNAILVEDDTNPDSSAFVVNSAGDVGIGTITPNQKLTVNGNISSNAVIYGSTFSFNPNISSTAYLFYDSNVKGPTLQMNGVSAAYIDLAPTLGDLTPGGLGDYGLRLGSWYDNLLGKVINFANSNKADFIFVVNDITRMAITTAGNVGIDTTTPNEKLTVNGVISSNNYIYSQDIYLNRGDTQREGGQINFARSFDNTTVFGIDTYTDNIGSLSSRLRFIDIPSNVERMTMLSSGNFGIGIMNPISKLHVDGDITVSNGRYLNLDTNTGGGYTAIRRNTGYNGMEFFTQSASRMFIADNAGNVGIGTLNPSEKLHVNGNAIVDGALILNSGPANATGTVDAQNLSATYITFQTNTTGTGGSSGPGFTDWAYLRQIGTVDNFHLALDMHDNSNTALGGQAFSIRNVGSADGSPNPIQTNFTVNNNGFIGIGTETPNKKLTVAGSISATELFLQDPYNYTTIRLGSNDNAGFHITKENETSSTPNSFNIWTGPWGTAPVNRMSILTSGNVGIGIANPTDKLHVTSITGAASAATRPAGWGGGITTWDVYATGTIGTGSLSGDLKAFIDNSGIINTVQLSGIGNRSVYSDSYGTLTNTSSDRTLKQSVSTISQGLDEVILLNPVSFNWKNTEKYGPQREIGFIAQEVQELIPEVIGTNSDGTLSLDYAKMIAVLTKSIQELNDKIDAQAKEITSLKAKIK